MVSLASPRENPEDAAYRRDKKLALEKAGGTALTFRHVAGPVRGVELPEGWEVIGEADEAHEKYYLIWRRWKPGDFDSVAVQEEDIPFIHEALQREKYQSKDELAMEDARRIGRRLALLGLGAAGAAAALLLVRGCNTKEEPRKAE